MARNIQSLSCRPAAVRIKPLPGMERIDTISRRLLHTLLRMQRNNLHHQNFRNEEGNSFEILWDSSRATHVTTSFTRKKEVGLLRECHDADSKTGRQQRDRTSTDAPVMFQSKTDYERHAKGMELIKEKSLNLNDDTEGRATLGEIYHQERVDERVEQLTEVHRSISIQEDLFSGLEKLSLSLSKSLESADMQWHCADGDTRVLVERCKERITIRITTSDSLRKEFLSEQSRIVESFTRHGFAVNSLIIECSNHE